MKGLVEVDAILIANVGNSDLQIATEVETPDGVVLPTEDPRGYNYRQATERLLSLEEVPDGVEFPLMQKYLRFIELEGYNLKRVYLFGTDQSANPLVHERFKAQDTIAAAQLLRKWLMTIRPGLSVKVLPCTEDPSDWDSMHTFFSQRLKRIRTDNETCLVAITGGPQAMNAMLLLHATDLLPNVILVSVSKSQEVAAANRLGWELKRRDLIRQVSSHLRQQDYFGALTLLDDGEELIVEKDRFRLARALVEYAHLRTAFRFREAAATANRAQRDARADAHRNLLSRLTNQAVWLDQVLLDPQKKKDEQLAAFRLHEIVDLAGWYERRGQLLVVVGLVYSFTDVAANVALNQYGAARRKGSLRLDPEWVAGHPDLAEYLDQAGIRWRELNINPRIAVAVLSWFGQQGDTRATGLARALEDYQPVLSLRNRTPVAHGTQGIAAEDIDYDGGIPALLESMRQVAEVLSGPAPEPWVPDLIQAVEELLGA